MWKRIVSFGAVVGAFAVVVYLGLSVGERQAEPQVAAELDEDAKDRLASEAALSRIAAESAAIDTLAAGAADEDAEPGAQATAPPGFVPEPLAVVHEATPPDGYSFVAYHDVARGPMSAEDLDRRQVPVDPPEWMADDDRALARVSGRDWTFGWVRLAEGADLEGLGVLLAAHGGEALGRSGDLVRVRLPSDPLGLQAIAASPTVVGLGAVPAERKVTDTLAERAAADSNDEVPVWITLMSDDPDGRWRRALRELGARVGRFDPSIRTYAAAIPLLALGPISEADFVLAVESIGRVEPTLEIAAPSMGADALRSYDAATGTFVGVGGASVPVGVMDTGLNVDHPDISSNRRSICGANFTNFFSARDEDRDLWLDYLEHGTHVTGTVVGNGAVRRDRVGMAPLVQDIRFAKAVSSSGSASALGWNRAMDWFATPTACAGDDTPRKALVINSSLGVDGDYWEGRSVVERKIDASVWETRQLFVTSAGNAADSALSDMAAAKSALAVGAAQNVGDIAGFSSLGPTGDGRLMPKVVGTGVSVAAARGAGARNGYNVFSGTSMSSPSVVGVAALVMDSVPQLKEQPAALRARLMASAVKPDAFLGDAFPLHNTNGPGTLNNVYGLGKVSARTAVLSRDDEDGWTGGSAAFDVDAGSHAYRDIVVPDGASRLDVVMTWDEPPAETIANPVLNDLDLWIDWDAWCGNIAACGQYSSRSRIDNVEWVIVPNPPPGVYRLKVVPNRIYGDHPRAGLAWTVIRGDSSPTLAVALDSDRVEVAPDEPFEIEVAVSSDAYVAAGVNLRIDCRTEVGSTACDELAYDEDSSTVHREDGLGRSLARDVYSVVVGEIGPEEEQAVTLSFAGQPAGSFRLHVSASGWNAASGDASVAVVVGEPASDLPAPVHRPPNDDFAMAIELAGMDGETTFDLVAATPDPGEPALPPVASHPVRGRSLWYLWTASETGLARFAVAQSVPGDYSDYVIVEVFRDGPVAGLEALVGPQLGGGVTFFAEQGETYRLRLGTYAPWLAGRQSAMPDLTLGWGPASQPRNDDYAFAAVLEGESGTVEGTNQGATTEPSEFMGNADATTPQSTAGWAASVWYRWTAPSNGDFRFSVSRESQLVAAFAGERVAAARMVSGVPARGGAPPTPEGMGSDAPGGIAFPATAGVEYRIGIATRSAYWAANDFELSWAPGARTSPGNDDFAAAAPTFGSSGFGRVAFDNLTVEHGEPPASGVRTAWWSWQPSADGRYTWRVDRIGGGLTNDEVPLQMAVFAGTELATVEVVAMDEGDETIELQLAFDARADTAYRLSLGLPRDAAQASLPPGLLIMEWGPTPDNDDFSNAAALGGMSGSVSGSNRFATTEKGERTGSLGDASLWWTFEPEQSGWIRFALDGPGGSKLAIYRVGADGGLELIRTSRNLDTVGATVSVEAGSRYVVRLGASTDDAGGMVGVGPGDDPGGGDNRGEFELGWGPSDPPALMRYVDTVASGQTAEDGSEIQLDTLGNQALNGDGTELYVATPAGIVVFARDAATGELAIADTLLDYPVFDPGTRMIWDEAGAALIVAACDAWLKFAAAEGGGIEPAGRIAGAPCPVGDVLVHGDFAHHVMTPWLIETFRFDDAHETLSAAGQNMIPGVANAVMTADGANLYAVADDRGEHSLFAIERDLETGSLGIATIIKDGSPARPDGDGEVRGLKDVRALAVQASHLFVSAGADGGVTLVFDLADRASPAFLGNLPSFQGGFGSCAHAQARHDADAVDVACGEGRLFTVQVGRDGSLYGSDLARGGYADSFGNPIPENANVQSFAASPDGRHLYVAGSVFFVEFGPLGVEFVDRNQLMIFERVHGD